jgi:hypothetical protein
LSEETGSEATLPGVFDARSSSSTTGSAEEATEMNSRERLLTAFTHRPPDRCPTYIWINDDAMEGLVQHLRVRSPEEAQEVLRIDKWHAVGSDVSYPNDYVSYPDDYQESIKAWVPPEYRDVPGFQVTGNGRVARIHEGVHYLEDTVWNPLQDAETEDDLDAYPFVQESWIQLPDGLEQEIKNYKDADYVVYAGLSHPFKSAWLLRGMNHVLTDYLIKPELLQAIYDRLYPLAISIGKCLVRAGVDIIQIVGDLAIQNSLIMSPDTWREFHKWRLGEMISELKGINPELQFYMHSDGDVSAIIEDLIAVGVDILNPIQPECIDPVQIKRQYGHRLTLHGAVSLQRTLPFGSPQDVKEEVRYLIENCNVNGGFVVGPSNVLFREIPPENIVALYEAVY